LALAAPQALSFRQDATKLTSIKSQICFQQSKRDRLPDPLFIIAPPRSYTSVIGGMIGQHPQIYGLPEVNLSHGETLGDMWDSVTAAMNFGTSGLLRLLAQLHENVQTDEAVLRARQWIMRRKHWSGKRVFDYLQETIGPDKIMVDKSPRNTMKLEHLQRLLAIFPRASFLHLTRHPQTQGKSTIELIKSYGDKDPSERNAHFSPDRVWTRSQTNILKFAESLSTGQYMRIKGEMLLSNPHFYLEQVCDWLGIDPGPDAIDRMLHPETSPYACIGPESAPFGNDPNFLENPKLDLARLAKIKEPPLYGPVEWLKGEEFSKPVIKLARQFGYG
jgi:Sulfotransferase family